MMQNQPLPKLNVTEVFYARQVWIYLLNFVISSEMNEGPDNNFIYTWLETESGRGPNEVCSALAHFFRVLEEKYKNLANLTLRLFSDSCSAQNKNKFIVGLLLNLVNKSNIFNEIEHIYPVRGHSYMPADRTFGRIEQELRRKSEIVSPAQYYKVMQKFSTVKVYGKDFEFYDYKKAVQPLLKSVLPFKISQQKIFYYNAGKKCTVGVSACYSATPVYVSVFRKSKNIFQLDSNIILLNKSNHVKEEKRKDVERLMKFFTVPADAIQFYNEVLNKTSNPNNDENLSYDEDEEEEII